ncbi:ABC transporter substrate-binding protein [Micromonospora sp. CPCC 205371]|nr:ABC transporter substrate-binding protein [Micromonospora sp. CPCC 205371]
MRLLISAGAVVATLVTAGCSASADKDNGGDAAGFDAARKGVVNASDATGGTLRLGGTSDCDSWDPAATYNGFCWNMQRLMTRTLVASPGYGDPARTMKPGELVPDLATALGESNADKTVWTYKLRPGVKFSSGAAITSTDIKYGFQRMWATDVISGGPAGYFLCLLDTCDGEGNPAYQGPYKDKTGGLARIETPDPQTIVFKLTSSFADFDYLMALPATAPVPKAADTGGTYTRKVTASGPFVMSEYTPGQGVTWTRNPHWSQDTDEVRRPKVDKVTLTLLSNPDDLDARLKNGSLDLSAGGGVQPTFQSEILNTASLKANADNPVSGFVGLFAIFPTAPSLDNVHCRRAIAYALDKRDLLVQSGGSFGGDFAATLLPPAVPGHDTKANAYPSGADWTGDLDKAKHELVECGKPDGFDTVMAYTNSGSDPQIFASVQAALKRVGITVTGKQQDESVYYGSYIGAPANVKQQQLGIAAIGWAPDYPSGNGFLSLLVDGARIQDEGTTNYVSVNDDVLNGLIKRATTAPLVEQAGIFQELDKQTMERAIYIPYFYQKFLLYRNPRLTNVDLRADLGSYDLVNLGVSDGK